MSAVSARGRELHRKYELEDVDAKRDAVGRALAAYVATLTNAAQSPNLDADERRQADVSRVQAMSAERVLWLD